MPSCGPNQQAAVVVMTVDCAIVNNGGNSQAANANFQANSQTTNTANASANLQVPPPANSQTFGQQFHQQQPTNQISQSSSLHQIHSQRSFCEEIDFNSIEILDHVGHGAYGVVHRGVWNGQVVAVKKIDNASEREAFLIELKQLSRVRHENIVKLYGACTKNPVCLVMEYAEGGSLDKVLHEIKPPPIYKAAHALSWALQCAQGVEYLHSMKPKALVHRDLKPQNLLLIDSGRRLKICDFGTVCDLHTYMTSNKGSAAYMAPEVFEGSQYTEKCDIYSFAIVLWQVITRARPFASYENHFTVLWEVQKGARPHPVKNCPKPITVLMENCWQQDPQLRPSMNNVVNRLTYLLQFFSGADEPLIYPEPDENVTEEEEDVYEIHMPMTYSASTGNNADDYTNCGTTIESGQLVPTLQPTFMSYKSHNVKEDTLSSFQSAPASLAGSQEQLASTSCASNFTNYYYPSPNDNDSLNVPPNFSTNSRAKNSGQFKKGHRKTASWDVDVKMLTEATVQLKVSIPPPQQPQCKPQFPPVAQHPQNFLPLRLDLPAEHMNGVNTPKHETFIPFTTPFAYLEEDLQPVEPMPDCPESIEIYRDHCLLADEFIRTRTEITLMLEQKQNLMRMMEDREKSISNNQKLLSERDQLIELRNSLKEQVEKLRR